MKFLLVISHLSILALGYFLMPSSPSAAPEPLEVEKRTRLRSTPLPSTENPILHASTEDFQNLFQGIINSPQDLGCLENLLIAWARIDPDAALLAFSHYYNPDHSDSFLRRLQQETGPLLAEALVKHFDQLSFVEPVDVMGAMGVSLGALANEDLTAALSLFEKLPKNTPEDLYDSFIGNLDGPQLLELFDQIPHSPAALKMAESNRFWKDASNRAWRQFSPEQFNQLFQKLDHPGAIKHLTAHAMAEAARFNDHDTLLQTLNGLSPEKQIHAIAAFKESSYHEKMLTSPLFLQAVAEHNAHDLLDRLNSASDK